MHLISMLSKKIPCLPQRRSLLLPPALACGRDMATAGYDTAGTSQNAAINEDTEMHLRNNKYFLSVLCASAVKFDLLRFHQF
jgi:hypothetical protein